MEELKDKEDAFNPVAKHAETLGKNPTVSAGTDLASKEDSFVSGDNLSKMASSGGATKGKLGSISGWSRAKKVGVGGGGLAGVFGVLAFTFIMSAFSGAAQQIQLSHILRKPFSIEEEASKSRFSKFLYGEENPAEGYSRLTKMQVLGNKVFGDPVKQLADKGVNFSTDGASHIKGLEIDPTKLDATKGLNPEDAKAALSDKLNIPKESINLTSDGKFTVDLADSSISGLRLVQENALSLLGDGKIMTFIKARGMASFFETPSLFHPIQRAKAKANAKTTDVVADVEAADKDLMEPENSNAELKNAEGTLKDSVDSNGLTLKDIGTSALILTAVICTFRDIADALIVVDRLGIAVPSATHATSQIAVGDQVASGKDFSLSQANAYSASSIDYSSGKPETLFAAKSLQVTEGNRRVGGKDIPASYRSGFDKNVTSARIKDTIGAGLFGAVACSPIGQVVQAVASVVIIVSGLFDFGASDAAFIGVKATVEGLGEVAAKGLAFQLGLNLIKSFVTDILKNPSIVPIVLKGALGGNILAYGAREAANTSVRSSGGVALTAAQAGILNSNAEKSDQVEFKNQPMFARLFNIYDYRTPVGKMAQMFTPNFMSNLGILADKFVAFMNVKTLFSNMSELFNLRAKADTQDASDPNNYYWGFDQFGIPQSMLDDPELSNPYANASQVTDILNSQPDLKDKIKTCFGLNVIQADGQYDVQTDNSQIGSVNPNSDGYNDKNCSDTSNSSWKRVVMWVFDSKTMESAACYNGDSSSCSSFGV